MYRPINSLTLGSSSVYMYTRTHTFACMCVRVYVRTYIHISSRGLNRHFKDAYRDDKLCRRFMCEYYETMNVLSADLTQSHLKRYCFCAHVT